ncbi:hypothetical protein BLNAU_16638 [Blattamonas nauphoetae]|uniref:Uncharacterized protein n=1 Tax=Blattamonas nauphoetae TaxID=2049346 RepID=A0ABQ9X863_9EUKA|nr:hypothetical protein BLNAU_16638 [Blattamonas nauphoetae]
MLAAVWHSEGEHGRTDEGVSCSSRSPKRFAFLRTSGSACGTLEQTPHFCCDAHVLHRSVSNRHTRHERWMHQPLRPRHSFVNRPSQSRRLSFAARPDVGEREVRYLILHNRPQNDRAE